ncbi:MAG: cutinase family protein [Segniliparus sp.]|uniref:cutinase family protein n=1 Tax=Segniliparus sp. TaxID=2804064 RepID=UPI003F35AAD3
MSKPPRSRQTAALWAAALLAAAGLALAPPQAPEARAAGCADVDVAFARGTDEPEGTGFVGESFTDALTERLPGRTITVYAVDYPATLDAPSAGAGGNDLSRHIQNIARTCPSTKIVIGGYSQGAAVVDLVVTTRPLPFTSVTVPFLGEISLADSGFDSLPPASVFPHIAAVALFGNPSHYVYPHPLPMPQGLEARTADLCVGGDPVCTPPDSGPTYFANHLLYVQNGLADQAADFVVDQLGLPAAQRSAPAPVPAETGQSDDDGSPDGE